MANCFGEDPGMVDCSRGSLGVVFSWEELQEKLNLRCLWSLALWS
jgi:hypothetical protein